METFEPPKYLEKLIAAINDGAKSAQLGALAFTAIGVFLLATAFSATDEDLLLNRALTISQLGGTAVPVVFAFGLAPAVFVAAHFYTLIRYDMLSENVRQLCEDLAVMVLSEADRRRCRQLLANVEFVNAMAMPKGSRASNWMFSWTVRMLLAVFPVTVLLFVQLQSLRLQSEWVNWTHHACIVADLVLQVWFFGRLRGDDNWYFWRAPVRRKVALCWMPAVVLLLDLAWLQVPGPDSQTVGKDLAAYSKQYPEIAGAFMQRVEWWSEFHPVDLLLCTPGAWGCRYLTVTHRIVVDKILDTTTFVALRAGADADKKHLASFEAASLSGRTLRFADLTASELFAADLNGADLRHAVLGGTTLRKAVLLQAQLQGAYLGTAELQGANLYQAELQDANLRKAQLEGANLRLAQLQGANLSEAQLQGADLSEAELQDASLSMAQLQGANLFQAELQGANLGEAELQGADLGMAELQGANLYQAKLQGADLRVAQLQGADLNTAELQGADLRWAGLWNVTSDENTRLGLVDLRRANFDAVQVEDLLAKLPVATPEAAKQRLRERLAAKVSGGILSQQVDTADGKILVTNPDDTDWRGLDRERQLTTEPADIDPALAKLLADTVASTSAGAAEVVARRVISPDDEDKRRPLIKLLGCRLQAQAEAKHVTLSAETINQLRAASGLCDQRSP
jgi:uncharacterized protein YjbI with pentapeptide repeats